MNIIKLHQLDEKIELEHKDLTHISRNGLDYKITIENFYDSIAVSELPGLPIWNANKFDNVPIDLHSRDIKDGMVLMYEDYHNAMMPVFLSYSNIDWSGLEKEKFLTINNNDNLITRDVTISDIKPNSPSDAGKYLRVNVEGTQVEVTEFDMSEFLIAPSSYLVDFLDAPNGIAYFTDATRNRPTLDFEYGYLLSAQSKRFTTRTIQLAFGSDENKLLFRNRTENTNLYDNWIELYHTGNLPHATTETAGIVRLSSSLTSSSETIAATSLAVKKLEDKKLDKNKNLSDVVNVPEARKNLSIYSKNEIDDKITNIEELIDMIIPVSTIRTQASNDGISIGVWMECNGREISRGQYATLFSKIGTRYGNGNGSTTFNIPDLRGEFIRGWDHGRGSDSGRQFGSAQTDDIQSHNHTASSTPSGNHTHNGTTTEDGSHVHRGATSNSGGHTHNANTTAAGNHSHSSSTSESGYHTHGGSTSSGGGHVHEFSIRATDEGSSPNNLTGGQAQGRLDGYFRSTTGYSGNHSHSLSISGSGQHSHSVNINNAGEHSHTVTVANSGNHTHDVTVNESGNHRHSITTSSEGSHSHAIGIGRTGGSETRPRNVAMMFYIRVA